MDNYKYKNFFQRFCFLQLALGILLSCGVSVSESADRAPKKKSTGKTSKTLAKRKSANVSESTDKASKKKSEKTSTGRRLASQERGKEKQRGKKRKSLEESPQTSAKGSDEKTRADKLAEETFQEAANEPSKASLFLRCKSKRGF
jgi:hypothetical protein